MWMAPKSMKAPTFRFPLGLKFRINCQKWTNSWEGAGGGAEQRCEVLEIKTGKKKKKKKEKTLELETLKECLEGFQLHISSNEMLLLVVIIGSHGLQ